MLTLRGLGDEAEAKTAGINKRDLLSLAAATPAKGKGVVAQPPPDKYKVEVIHGSSRNVVEF